MALGLTHPLIEISAMNLPGGLSAGSLAAIGEPIA
jgi:hypothetical protein